MNYLDTTTATGGVARYDTQQSLDAFADRIERLKLIDLPRARSLCSELIARSESLGYGPGILRGKLLHVWCLRMSGNPMATQALAEDVIRLARSAGNAGAEAAGMLELGMLMIERGEIRESEQILANARAIARRASNPKEESRIIVAQSLIHIRLDNYDEALALCELALDTALNAGADEPAAAAMYGLCIVAYQRGQGTLALEYCTRLVDMAMRTGNMRYRMMAEEFRAVIVRELKGDEPSVEPLMKALEFWRRQGDLRRTGTALANIGMTYKQIGNFACALESLTESLALGNQCGDRAGEAVRLLMLGQLYQATGEEWRELDCYHQALQRARTTNHYSAESSILICLGEFYQNRGEMARALSCFIRAKELVSSRSTISTQIDLIHQIGCTHVLLSAFDVAEEYLLAALKLARRHDRRRQELFILRDLGILEERRSRNHEALHYLRTALAIAAGNGFRTTRTMILASMIQLCIRMGDDAGRARYERRYALLAQSIFSSEQARSLRRIIEQYHNMDPVSRDVAKGFGPETVRLLGIRIPVEQPDGSEPDATARMFTESFVPWPPAHDGLNCLDRLPAKPVCIRALGVLEINIGEHLLERRDWSRKRAREMFKLLLVNRDRWLSTDEIHDILWDGKPSRNPDMLVANAVSHIRRVFSTHAGDHDGAVAVECRDGAYRLHLSNEVWVDFHAFKELVFAARHVINAADRMRLYGMAIDLYAGDFLAENQYDEWAALERDTLRNGYLEALEFTAAEQRRLGRNTDAIETAWRILRTDATNCTALEALVCAMAAEGRMSEARRVLADRTPLFRNEADGDKLLAYLGTFIQDHVYNHC